MTITTCNRCCSEALLAVRILPGGVADEADALFSEIEFPKPIRARKRCHSMRVKKPINAPQPNPPLKTQHYKLLINRENAASASSVTPTNAVFERTHKLVNTRI